MPLITELPITQSTRPSHGWAYVPDTGAPIAAMAASTRKRGGPRDPTDNKILQNNPSVKQQKAIQQRLDRLAEDNWSSSNKQQTIPIPARTRPAKKSTQNVRRILASERQFKHWHDEHVALQQAGPVVVGQTDVQGSTTGSARRTSAAAHQLLPMHPPPKPAVATPRRRSGKIEDSAPQKSSPLVGSTAPPGEGAEESKKEDTAVVDPLLVTRGIPKLLSKRLMDLLLAEAPLSWDAAAARPLENEKRLPARHFCGVCGYWGKVRCKRCGERTCGLMECWRGHEASCAVPAY